MRRPLAALFPEDTARPVSLQEFLSLSFPRNLVSLGLFPSPHMSFP